jgi:hypothetical protein
MEEAHDSSKDDEDEGEEEEEEGLRKPMNPEPAEWRSGM